MSAPAPITALRAVRADTVERVGAIGRAVALMVEHGDAGVMEVATAVADWLDQPDATVTLDVALGLPATWRSDIRRGRRDAALIDLARRRFPGLEGREAARAVATAARRYEGSSWPRDRRANRRPDGLSGDLFDVLSHGDMPSEATLRRIFMTLSGSNDLVAMRQRSGDAA
jgi:hypothetical protein